MSHITTSELDNIARLGLDDLRSCFTTDANEGSKEKAELTLKILRQGTSRMSGENNRLAIALKIAKAAGVAQEDQRVLWNQIASSQVEGKSPAALAPPESTGSTESTTPDSGKSKAPTDRSKRTA